MPIETVEEENYFFRFSKYQDALLKLYDERSDFVVPKNRLVEIRNFVASGLQDFSISRLSSKMSWGIPVPGDEKHVMYVWFDALANYITTLGWPARIATRSVAGGPEDKIDLGDDIDVQSDFERFWPGLQIAGKDNLRQQSAMWTAMLFSAGLDPSRQILIHGHIMVGGQKMSKSLGNVISPDELVEKFGKDGTRYLLLSSGNLENDPDITMERLTEKYNADLANGLGNLISRVLKLSEKLDADLEVEPLSGVKFPEELGKILDEYRFADATEYVMGLVREANRHIDEEKPWELVKTDMERFDGVMRVLLDRLALIASALAPLLPETSEKITKALVDGKVEPLFKRV
jgi:methionyl-tRNA synthetase